MKNLKRSILVLILFVTIALAFSSCGLLGLKQRDGSGQRGDGSGGGPFSSISLTEINVFNIVLNS
jgi:hypothetical protein